MIRESDRDGCWDGDELGNASEFPETASLSDLSSPSFSFLFFLVSSSLFGAEVLSEKALASSPGTETVQLDKEGVEGREKSNGVWAVGEIMGEELTAERGKGAKELNGTLEFTVPADKGGVEGTGGGEPEHFLEEQVEELKDGQTGGGYVWHAEAFPFPSFLRVGG